MAPASPSVVQVSGPLILGYLLDWGLFGVLSVQVYFYHLAFPQDRRANKFLVAGIYILEITQTVLLTHDAFTTFATHYGDVGFLSKLQLIPFSVPIITGLGLVVQMRYGYLLKLLSGSKLLGLTVAFLSVVQCCGAFVQGVQAFIIDDFSALTAKTSASETVWLASSAICDLVIAFAMTIILLRKDSHLPATHTTALITKLVRIIVETGCLTAFAATIQMTLFISLPNKPYFTSIGLAKLYSNSLLAIFNSRIRILGVHSPSQAQMTALSSMAFRVQSVVSHSTTLPHVHESKPETDEAGSRIVTVRIQQQTEIWGGSDDSIPTA